ncbi:hypothetical protein AGMMS49944_07030 [Spirochaetia bacterium]|nr:hypothetical protein AGMMS49944_07030 [Spirochaetia bacterium]
MLVLLGILFCCAPTADSVGMVRINGGTFTMGSPSSEVGRFYDEGPQHSVTGRGLPRLSGLLFPAGDRLDE